MPTILTVWLNRSQPIGSRRFRRHMLITSVGGTFCLALLCLYAFPALVANAAEPAQVVATSDFGDAPASYGDAEHVGGGTLFLGTVAPDLETGSSYSATADGDDLNGSDDEEGVTMRLAFGLRPTRAS